MRILYFGIYDPTFSRNRIYISGLRRNGVEVLECRDVSKGLIKYLKLFKKHWKMRDSYDAVVVGYPGHAVVWLARLICKKPVIADLLGSLEDAEIHSHHPTFFKRIKAKIADWLAVRFANIVLLESKAQKEFFDKKFSLHNKFCVLYTGADDSWWKGILKAKQSNNFLVVFRGRLSPESGIHYVLEAAEILKNNQNIRFRIIGGGGVVETVRHFIKGHGLKNVELISEHLSDQEMVRLAEEADLFIGQLENNPRLNRTIPHKAFEAFALGIPYLSGSAPAIHEIVDDGETGYLVPLADSSALAQKIEDLSNKHQSFAHVSKQELNAFEKKYSPSVLAKELLDIING